MTSAIDVAEKALAVKTGLKKVLGPQAANLQGRHVEHWSYKVLAVGAGVGLIAVVVFAILNMVPAAIVGGVLLATNLVGAFYLHRFRLYDQLEDYVKEMANRINLFGNRIAELKDENKKLAVIDKDLGKIPEHWKVEIEKGKKELLEVHKKFELLKKSYETVLIKLAKFSTISKTLQDETGTLAKETQKISEENKLLGGNIGRISEGLDVFHKHNADISDQNKELDKATQELDRLEKELNKTLEVIKGLSVSLKAVYSKIREMMTNFDKKVNDLHEVYPDIKANKDEMQQLNKQIIELKEKIEGFLSKEAELQELRAFKEAKKVEFEAWQKKH